MQNCMQPPNMNYAYLLFLLVHTSISSVSTELLYIKQGFEGYLQTTEVDL